MRAWARPLAVKAISSSSVVMPRLVVVSKAHGMVCVSLSRMIVCVCTDLYAPGRRPPPRLDLPFCSSSSGIALADPLHHLLPVDYQVSSDATPPKCKPSPQVQWTRFDLYPWLLTLKTFSAMPTLRWWIFVSSFIEIPPQRYRASHKSSVNRRTTDVQSAGWTTGKHNACCWWRRHIARAEKKQIFRKKCF